MMKKKKLVARFKAIMAQVKILVAYFQVLVGFLGVGTVEYPASFGNLMGSFSFVNIDVIAMMRALCVGDFGFYGVFLWNTLFPIVVTLLIVLHYFITKPKGEAGDPETLRKFSAFSWTMFCMLLFTIYPTSSSAVLKMFHCHELQFSDSETKSYLYADYSIQCYEGSWNGYAAMAGFMLLVYPIGIPVFFIMALYPHTKIAADGRPLEEARLEDPDTKPALFKDPVLGEMFGFLYGRFKPEYWWYETSELCRKLLVGSLSMFIMSGSATQIIVAIGFNTYFLCQVLVCWPFKNYDDNCLMATALTATTVTLFGALILAAQIDILDKYADGVTTGLLLGTTVTLFILYLVMLLKFQLPFACNWYCPEFIRVSPLNCFKPQPPPGKPAPKPAASDSKGSETKAVEINPLCPVVLPPPPPQPPAPELKMEVDELDDLIDTYFNRYDLDESGSLNSNEELQQLATNLSFKLRLTLTGDEIDAIVESAGELSNDNEWAVADFGEWYKDRFLSIFDASDMSLQGDMAMAIGMAQNADMNADLAAEMDGDDDDEDDGGDGDG
jgi:hypothetical protein